MEDEKGGRGLILFRLSPQRLWPFGHLKRNPAEGLCRRSSSSRGRQEGVGASILALQACSSLDFRCTGSFDKAGSKSRRSRSRSFWLLLGLLGEWLLQH